MQPNESACRAWAVELQCKVSHSKIQNSAPSSEPVTLRSKFGAAHICRIHVKVDLCVQIKFYRWTAACAPKFGAAHEKWFCDLCSVYTNLPSGLACPPPLPPIIFHLVCQYSFGRTTAHTPGTCHKRRTRHRRSGEHRPPRRPRPPPRTRKN